MRPIVKELFLGYMWAIGRKHRNHVCPRKSFYFKENIMEEIWKPIEELFGLYEVSNTGLIRKIKTSKLMKPKLNFKGYQRIVFIIKGKRFTKRVHRLVAMAFIPNPNNLPQVNHKDGNKLNNCVNNLEWVTNEQNMKHALEHGLHKGVIKPIALIKNGIEIARYKNIKEASIFNNVSKNSIYYQVSSKCKHKYKKTKENVWIYV